MRDRRRGLGTLWGAGAIALALGALAPAVAGAAEGARVTAVVGAAKTGADQPLERLGAVGEEQPLETGEDGGCSLLLEEDALVEICGDTALSLRKRAPGQPRVLDVQKGNVRVSAEPRLGDERIEIHTPAAIATILGTVVFVSVDALGVTTLTSEMSRVMVASSDPAISQATVINGGQQLVIQPGEPPPAVPERLDTKQLSDLGGCLVDFHAASLESDRKAMQDKAAEEIAESDAAVVELPEIALAEPPTDQGAGGPGDPGSDPTGGNDVYNPTQSDPDLQEQIDEILNGDDQGFPGGECPPGLPGDQCGPF
jgi:hypothetical protein